MKKKKSSAKHSGGFAAKHALGQNFILDDALTGQLAELSMATAEDFVLEIGPGMGTLTRALAQRAAHVLAIEVDRTLEPYLRVALEGCGNAEILFADVLSVDLREICQKWTADNPLRVCANIPYYITTEILEKVMMELPQARSMAFMVQDEVAQKLMSGPGQDGYGPLAVNTQMNYIIRRALDVPAECFTPKPKVDSAFVVLERQKPPYELRDPVFFRKMVKGIFLLRRKTLLNNLISFYHLDRAQALEILEHADLEENIRAEALTLEQMARLSNKIADVLQAD